MTNLFDGLFLFEIILMILGSVLFLVVIFLIVKNKEITKNHLAGIGFSILMIAFPSIKSFSISDGIINIERDLEELKENPNNPEIQKELEEDVGNIGERPISNTERLSTLSEANLELGKTERATTLANEVLKKSPKNLTAKEVVNVIEVEKTIDNVQSNPSNIDAKATLKKQIETLKKIRTESGRRTSQIAKGYQALGNEKMVQVYIDSTRMYQPKHPIIKKYENKAPLIPVERSENN